MKSLLELCVMAGLPSEEDQQFLKSREGTIASDLWESAGGYWEDESIERIRQKAVQQWISFRQQSPQPNMDEAWVQVVRDFHHNHWGEEKLSRKPKKEKTEEQKIFWELFSYIWALLQAALVTKTAVFYFGIKSANEDSAEGKVYVTLAILFSFVSLTWFAIRKTKNKSQKEDV